LVIASLAAPLFHDAFATTVFSDGTFNLGDYTIQTFGVQSGDSVTASQILTGGNPGAALETSFNVASPTSATAQLYFNNGWHYDPSSQGSVLSLDISADRMVATFVLGVSSVIQQGGSYYLVNIPAAAGSTPRPGTWNTFSGTGFHSSDYSLFDPATDTLDSTVHPNFLTGGLILFGFRAGAQSNSQLLIDTDNVSYTLQTPVPLPGALGLLGGGLVGFFGVGFRKRSDKGLHQQQTPTEG
jgi:hypothetical protein